MLSWNNIAIQHILFGTTCLIWYLSWVVSNWINLLKLILKKGHTCKCDVWCPLWSYVYLQCTLWINVPHGPVYYIANAWWAFTIWHMAYCATQPMSCLVIYLNLILFVMHHIVQKVSCGWACHIINVMCCDLFALSLFPICNILQGSMCNVDQCCSRHNVLCAVCPNVLHLCVVVFLHISLFTICCVAQCAMIHCSMFFNVSHGQCDVWWH